MLRRDPLVVYTALAAVGILFVTLATALIFTAT